MATLTIGIDLGKTVFHLIAIDERGSVSSRRRFHRKPTGQLDWDGGLLRGALPWRRAR